MDADEFCVVELGTWRAVWVDALVISFVCRRYTYNLNQLAQVSLTIVVVSFGTLRSLNTLTRKRILNELVVTDTLELIEAKVLSFRTLDTLVVLAELWRLTFHFGVWILPAVDCLTHVCSCIYHFLIVSTSTLEGVVVEKLIWRAAWQDALVVMSVHGKFTMDWHFYTLAYLYVVSVTDQTTIEVILLLIAVITKTYVELTVIERVLTTERLEAKSVFCQVRIIACRAFVCCAAEVSTRCTVCAVSVDYKLGGFTADRLVIRAVVRSVFLCSCDSILTRQTIIV